MAMGVGVIGAAAAMALAGAGGAAPADDLAGIPAADRALAVASRGWTRLARRPDPSLRGLEGAHPGAKSIRVSRSRAELTGRDGRQRFPYPARTVVVKTGTVNGAVTLVAFMRRVAAGDGTAAWRYAEYTRPSSGGTFRRVGGGQSLCSGCHLTASRTQRSDYVFSRLAPR